MPDEVVEDTAPPPPPPPTPAPPEQPAREEETVVQPAAEEPETVAQAEERVSAARRSFAEVEEEARVRHRLDPLQPRPRRRWLFFGPYQRRDESAGDDSEA